MGEHSISYGDDCGQAIVERTFNNLTHMQVNRRHGIGVDQLTDQVFSFWIVDRVVQRVRFFNWNKFSQRIIRDYIGCGIELWLVKCSNSAVTKSASALPAALQATWRIFVASSISVFLFRRDVEDLLHQDLLFLHYSGPKTPGTGRRQKSRNLEPVAVYK